MADFRVPDDRFLNAAESGLQPWPATPDGYRLFIHGSGGPEKIGIHLGQSIELQLTGGNGCRIETMQSQTARLLAAGSGGDASRLEAASPPPVSLSVAVAASDKQKFTVTAKSPGVTYLYATDPSGNRKAELAVVTGTFDKHPGMEVDLIADICKGSDSLKIHALQRMLNNRWVASSDPTIWIFNNGDNIFEQNSQSNRSSNPKIGNMTCGLVAKWRGEQVFAKITGIKPDWYQVGAIHEPLRKKPAKRSDLKYRSSRVETLRTQIAQALRRGEAVRVGVVDRPTDMTPVGGYLVTYYDGGHTLLIVGCNKDNSQFLYIDPWGGGSAMEYKGGFAGNNFPGECQQLGKLVLAYDPDRRVKATDTANNMIREHPDTQGSFSYAKDNYLEVVSAPFLVLGR